jgi:hypothetical protein
MGLRKASDTLLDKPGSPRPPRWIPLAAFSAGLVFFIAAAWVVGRWSAASAAGGLPAGWELTVSALGRTTEQLPVIPSGYVFVIDVSGEAQYRIPNSEALSLRTGSLVSVQSGGSLTTGAGRLKIGLTDGSIVYLDGGTDVVLDHIADPPSDPTATRLILGRGRLMLKTARLPGNASTITTSAGYSAEATGSLMGVEYPDGADRLDADCLLDRCRIRLGAEIRDLAEGQHSWIERGRLGGLDPARYDRWLALAGPDVLWFTPTSTRTVSRSVTPTPTGTRTPVPPTAPVSNNPGGGADPPTFTPTGTGVVTVISPVVTTTTAVVTWISPDPATTTPPPTATTVPDTQVPNTSTPVPTLPPAQPTSTPNPTVPQHPPTKTPHPSKTPKGGNTALPPTNSPPAVANPPQSDPSLTPANPILPTIT